MAGQRLIIIDANDLLELFKHYTAYADENIPIDGEVKNVGFHHGLPRYIKFLVSGKWTAPERHAGGGMDPLHIRYTGGRVMTWGEKGTDVSWAESEETKS